MSARFEPPQEVKGRLRGQPVRLTTNEWYKAQQLAETYWLYVVWDPLGELPELVRIHNPAKVSHARECWTCLPAAGQFRLRLPGWAASRMLSI